MNRRHFFRIVAAAPLAAIAPKTGLGERIAGWLDLGNYLRMSGATTPWCSSGFQYQLWRQQITPLVFGNVVRYGFDKNGNTVQMTGDWPGEPL